MISPPVGLGISGYPGHFFVGNLRMRIIRNNCITRWLVLLIAAATTPLPAVGQTAAEVSIRAELAAPLQDVQKLFRDKQFSAALKALAQADAIPNRTDDENLLLERLRAACASNAGDLDQAALAYERLSRFSKVTPAERLNFLEVLTTLHLKRKAFGDSQKAATRYIAEGGRKPSVRLMLAQAAFFSNDANTTVAQTGELIALARQANTVPEKDILILQANALQALKDDAGMVRTLETLVEFHPQGSYWNDLLGRVQSEPGFPPDSLLDLYRLQYATGSLGAGEALEMGQMAIKQGFPLEAVQALKQALANVQSDAERTALQDALKQAEQLAAADVTLSASASAGASATLPAGVAGSASAGKPGAGGKPGADSKASAQVKADASVKAGARAPGFASLYQRWLTAPSADAATALAAVVTGEAATPVNRLRLGAVRAQAGQVDEARALFDGLLAQGGGSGRLARLWLLHLKKAPAP